jgi:hypothetical protein
MRFDFISSCDKASDPWPRLEEFLRVMDDISLALALYGENIP